MKPYITLLDSSSVYCYLIYMATRECLFIQYEMHDEMMCRYLSYLIITFIPYKCTFIETFVLIATTKYFTHFFPKNINLLQ